MDMRKIIPSILTLAGAVLKIFFDGKIAREREDKAIAESIERMDGKLNKTVNYLIEQKAVDTAARSILNAVKEVQKEESSDSENTEEMAEEAPK